MEKSECENLQNEMDTFQIFSNSRRSPRKLEYFVENSEKIVENKMKEPLEENPEEPREKQPEMQPAKQPDMQLEEPPEKKPENKLEKEPGKQPEKKPEKKPGKEPERQPERQPEKQPEKHPKEHPTEYPSEHHKNPRYLRNSAPKNPSDHFNPSMRLLKLTKSPRGLCGFYLTRSKWDPYPWVSAVDAATPAERSGLKAGDCVLEVSIKPCHIRVNGADVLGLRIKDVAELVKEKSDCVTLLVWNTGGELKCDPESLCCGPMPLSLQRLSVIVQNVLSIIECPVCLDTIRPPAMQCQNGHLLCVNCRIRAEKCPVCRDRYTPRRALIAEQIYASITNAFNLCNNADKLRQQLFGPNVQTPKSTATQMQNVSLVAKPHKQKTNTTRSTRHKFLAKLLGKAYSMDNLTDSSVMPNSNQATSIQSPSPWAVTSTSKSVQSATNQLQYSNEKAAAMRTTASGTGSGWSVASSSMTALSSTSTELHGSEALQAKSTFKHSSLPTNDLSLDAAPITIARNPTEQHLSTNSSNSRCSKNTSSRSTSALKLQASI